MTQDKKSDVRKRSYAFALRIIMLAEYFTDKPVSRIITAQLVRSATSIGANITEAQAGSSKRDFAHYLNIALKSANETTYWLNLLRDSGKGDRETINSLLEETQQIAKILASSIITLKKRRASQPD